MREGSQVSAQRAQRADANLGLLAENLKAQRTQKRTAESAERITDLRRTPGRPRLNTRNAECRVLNAVFLFYFWLSILSFRCLAQASALLFLPCAELTLFTE
jgi:hypothetical protein